MFKRAARLHRLPTYIFVEINQQVQALTAAGHNILRLDIGSPDLPPPPMVIESLQKAAANPAKHGYSGYRGMPDFRRAVADYYQRRFGVTVDADREVLPLIGSKEGIVNLALAYLDAGDAVLVPTPGYPAYAMGAKLAGAEVYWVRLAAENGFQVDLTQLDPEAVSRSKMLWVNYPNNPTGATVDLNHFQELVNFCREHNLILASDNPYVDVMYDGYVAPSVLQAEGALETSIEFVSFSKTYNMAGWRLGAAVGNRELIDGLLQVKSNMDSGHFKAIYDAGITALTETPQSWIDERNARYARRRDLIMEALPEIGLSAMCPQGAMYIWAKTADNDGTAYVHNALNHAHVSLAPGGAYGEGSEGYVRFSISVPEAQLEEAIHRLKTWYAKSL